MTRTGQAAIDAAEGSVGANVMPDSGLCLAFVRGNVFDVAAYYGSAVDAWYGAEDRHPGDRNPPPAVPVWFNSASPYEHVAFHSGGGRYITTYNDDVRAYSLADMEAIYGPAVGWAPSINEVTIWTAPPPPEDDMPSAQEIAAAVWSYALDRPTGPVADAGRYLVDARVLLGDPNAALVPLAKQVWDVQVARPNGPPVDAGTYLVDTRASVAPVTAGPVLVADQVWDAVPESVVASRSYNLAVFALVVLVAVVGGVAVGLLADTQTGVVAGVAALVGGLLAVILRNLPGGGGKHRG